jgi:hypothetical protein
VVLIVLVLSACDALRGTPPSPTPGDFGTLAQALSQRGITAEKAVSGDPGCDDPTLAPTAISFTASGLDQPAAVRLRVYLFRDNPAYERRRADVDTCAAAWATDSASFELVDASPFVIAGQGPWGAEFKAALRDALIQAAGG